MIITEVCRHKLLTETDYLNDFRLNIFGISNGDDIKIIFCSQFKLSSINNICGIILNMFYTSLFNKKNNLSLQCDIDINMNVKHYNERQCGQFLEEFESRNVKLIIL